MPVKSKHLVHLVPHGINPESLKPIVYNDKKLTELKHKVLKGKKYEFVVFYNSRNVHRKRTSNIILAFRSFCDNLTAEEASQCVLLLHTEKSLEAGTDLVAVKTALCPKYNVVFTEERFSPEDLNLLYNIADVTINISSNEGFGLSIAESIMAGTPVIVNVTGGLQDQIGQTDDAGNPVEFNIDFGSNNVGKYKTHGVWAKPIWPVASYIQGSVPTPYIFDDICRWEDVAEAIMYWYLIPNEPREKYGLEGRRWAMNEGGLSVDNLSKQFIKAMDFTLENFEPVKPFSIHNSNEAFNFEMKDDKPGFEIPKIDKDKILKEINKFSV